MHFESCGYIDNSMDHLSISGSKDCPRCMYDSLSMTVLDFLYGAASLSVVDTLFTVAGAAGSLLNESEAISLSGSIVQCPELPNFPYVVDDFTAAQLYGAPVVCGGYNG